jgi:hypothetical protein
MVLRSSAPRLTITQILAWADRHYERHGRWPRTKRDTVDEVAGLTWFRVDADLRYGHRGLPGGSSLARLLVRRRGARSTRYLPPLGIRQILRWADAHRQRLGAWPSQWSGPIPDSGGETWQSVNRALRNGARGLPAGSSLLKLLARERGRRHQGAPPRLQIETIVAWIAAHFERTGEWPTPRSGVVADAPEETWSAVRQALKHGTRGLPPGVTLSYLVRHYHLAKVMAEANQELWVGQTRLATPAEAVVHLAALQVRGKL